MVADIKKYWEAETVDCPSTTVPQLITILRGGESITLKSPVTTKDLHWIGVSKDMTTLHSYQLDKGEAMTLTLPASFGRNNYIEIYALPETAGDDVCFFKLINLEPSTEAST